MDLGQYMGALRPGRKTPPVYEHEIVLWLPMQHVKVARDRSTGIRSPSHHVNRGRRGTSRGEMKSPGLILDLNSGGE